MYHYILFQDLTWNGPPTTKHSHDNHVAVARVRGLKTLSCLNAMALSESFIKTGQFLQRLDTYTHISYMT
jgi:hypothetical protein